MKKIIYFLSCMSLLLTLLIGCSSTSTTGNTPEQAARNFLDATKQQNFSSATTYYSQNLDNVGLFRNQLEGISPKFANVLFERMCDFTYEVTDVTPDTQDANHATVTTTITAYDLGQAFEQMVVDYMKSNIEMTLEGAKGDDIISYADDQLTPIVEQSKKNFVAVVPISVIKDGDTWKVDKITNSSGLANALSGNILKTIEQLEASIRQ